MSKYFSSINKSIIAIIIVQAIGILRSFLLTTCKSLWLKLKDKEHKENSEKGRKWRLTWIKNSLSGQLHRNWDLCFPPYATASYSFSFSVLVQAEGVCTTFWTHPQSLFLFHAKMTLAFQSLSNIYVHKIIKKYINTNNHNFALRNRAHWKVPHGKMQMS